MKEANMKKIISVILLISLLFNCCSNIVYANDLGDNQNEKCRKNLYICESGKHKS